MKKLTVILLLAACLSLTGCQTHFSLFGSKPVTPSTDAPKPKPVATATALGAADVQTEQVTLLATSQIIEGVKEIRSSAKGNAIETVIAPPLAKIETAALNVNAEIAFHPAAVVQTTLIKQAKQLEADAAPDWRITAVLSALAALCLAGAAVAQFARGWLVTVPLVGVFLSDLIGPRIIKLLAAIGAGFIVLARAYVWCAKHPHWVDAFIILIAVTLGILYANTVDAGWFAKAEAWLKSKLPWVKHTAEVLEADAVKAEQRTAAFVRAEWAKLHGTS